MGNSIGGGKKRAKIMKIDGEIFKVTIPATAMDVLKDYPDGYVLLQLEAVKRYGIRAPELRPEDEIKPGKIYFLVELPKFPEPETRRATTVARVNSAEERLKGLMLRQKPGPDNGSEPEPVRVKIRVPKARIEKLMEESRDEAEVAEKIVHLCLQNCSYHEMGLD